MQFVCLHPGQLHTCVHIQRMREWASQGKKQYQWSFVESSRKAHLCADKKVLRLRSVLQNKRLFGELLNIKLLLYWVALVRSRVHRVHSPPSTATCVVVHIFWIWSQSIQTFLSIYLTNITLASRPDAHTSCQPNQNISTVQNGKSSCWIALCCSICMHIWLNMLVPNDLSANPNNTLLSFRLINRNSASLVFLISPNLNSSLL